MLFTADGKGQRLPWVFIFSWHIFYCSLQIQYFHSTVYRQPLPFDVTSTILNSIYNSIRMTVFHTKHSKTLCSKFQKTVVLWLQLSILCMKIFEENCASILEKLLQTSTQLDNLLNFMRLWSVMRAVKHDSQKWLWLANAYTDACHAMRRWKTAVRNLVSGFSLPGISSSYPASKKSLILRLGTHLKGDRRLEGKG